MVIASTKNTFSFYKKNNRSEKSFADSLNFLGASHVRNIAEIFNKFSFSLYYFNVYTDKLNSYSVKVNQR